MARRALILAGGGMRVAWQAGVVRALAEAGVTFDHVDGTSGGILNAAMLLSGVGPEELGERWSTLDPLAFAAPLPPSAYVKGPTHLPALGSSDGVRGKVFPHLGIDVAAINAATHPTGSFNVCDFTDKACVAVPHTEVDEDLLVAGISLPVVMPAVARDGRTYTDAVWVKDANLVEAVDRGADELWLVWCIGNTPRWGNGPLEQYVHMIEMSAVGGLAADLAQLRARGADVRLHVVRPRYPLPLDPEYLLGRIDGRTLVAMGYRDARRYLSTCSDSGLPLDASTTGMEEPPVGLRLVERAHGRTSAGDRVTLEICVEVRDVAAFVADPTTGTDLVGWVMREGRWTPLADGRLRIVGNEHVYTADGVRATRRLRPGVGWRRGWVAATTVELVVAGEAPVLLRSGLGDLRRALTSTEPTGCRGLLDRLRVASTFWRFVAGRLRHRSDSERSAAGPGPGPGR